MSQLHIFDPFANLPKAPSTRYQGSKSKLLPWLWERIRPIDFDSALDAFGGTGAVSYLLKTCGKAVTYNDYLTSNATCAMAFVANDDTRVEPNEVDDLMVRHGGQAYDTLIERVYQDIFFLPEENCWLDVVAQNILRVADPIKRAIAFYALAQSCIAKRPYNLFHRANLYMRTADVERSFGNKATWDKPFEEHFREFVDEINTKVYNSGRPCRVICSDALEVEPAFDLVYIDTPYLNRSGVGVDYADFYSFLEGLANYETWESRIDLRRKHRPFKGPQSPWNDQKKIHEAFRRLFERFHRSTIVVSYRSDGIPSEAELVRLLTRVKRNVRVHHSGDYKYVLSTNNESKEILLIGAD
jgi:adenine-specific DNA methylase